MTGHPVGAPGRRGKADPVNSDAVTRYRTQGARHANYDKHAEQRARMPAYPMEVLILVAASETSWLAVTLAHPTGHNPGSRRPSLIFVKLVEHDIRVLIFGMGRVVAIFRSIPSSLKPRRTFTIFHGRFCLLRCSIRSTA